MSIVLASILDADWLNLRAEVEAADVAGVDGFSIDIMDGHFVPRITFGPQNVAMIRNWTDKPLEVHLMVDDPESLVGKFADAGADQITFHFEASQDPIRLCESIHASGLLAGLAVRAETSITALPDSVLQLVDSVNVMAVPVGFGGAEPDPHARGRISELRAKLDALSSLATIEVDGGVKPVNVGDFQAAGADLLVIGTGIYHSDDYQIAVRTAHENLAPDGSSADRVSPLIARPARNLEGDQGRRERLEALRESLDIPRKSWDPLSSRR